MKKVTIPGDKNTPAKIFEIGEVWVVTSSNNIPMFLSVSNITDKNIIFNDLITGKKSIRIPNNQHSAYSKHAHNDQKRILRLLFEINKEIL